MTDQPERPKTGRLRFSGHQTFAFRYGWLEKGIHAVADRGASALSADDALVQLGVGKNMVDSIRYWCLAAQILQPDVGACRPSDRELQPTPIGRRLLLRQGWDPFLEDDASLWLLHWLLVSNPRIVTTWQIVFSAFRRPDTTKRDLVDFVAAFAQKHGARSNEASLGRDVDCFLRTYVAIKSGSRQTPAEESFDCPLQELNLLQVSPEGEMYRFSIGAKPSLPAAVFGFALSEYFDRVRGGRSTMSVQECLYGVGSPGQAFKLDENSVVEYVEELGKLTHQGIALDETAGLKQIYRKHTLEPENLLARYYAGEGRR